MRFTWRLLSTTMLIVSVVALWACSALTVKTLVLAVAGAFVVKKYGDFRRNAWVTATIKEIEERWPK
jgi:hypothetical protein